MARHMTIAQLARAMEVDPRTVAGWQAGRSLPRYERLVVLSELLDVSPSYLLDDGNGRS